MFLGLLKVCLLPLLRPFQRLLIDSSCSSIKSGPPIYDQMLRSGRRPLTPDDSVPSGDEEPAEHSPARAIAPHSPVLHQVTDIELVHFSLSVFFMFEASVQMLCTKGVLQERSLTGFIISKLKQLS